MNFSAKRPNKRIRSKSTTANYIIPVQFIQPKFQIINTVSKEEYFQKCQVIKPTLIQGHIRAIPTDVMEQNNVLQLPKSYVVNGKLTLIGDMKKWTAPTDICDIPFEKKEESKSTIQKSTITWDEVTIGRRIQEYLKLYNNQL